MYYLPMSGEKNKLKKLNAQELVFKDRYLNTMNAYQSAIDAKYAETTALKKSSAWVGKSRNACPANKRHLWDAVYKAMQERSEETNIDAKFVLTNLAAMIQADPIDIIDEETGAYKRIHDWPLVWRRMLSAADVQEIYEGYGKDRKSIGEIIKYKFIDKLKAFELLGKHVNVQAFKDKIDLGVAIGISIDGEDKDL